MTAIRFLLFFFLFCITSSITAQTVTELWVENGDRPVYGVLSTPADSTPQHPVVIIAHGFNGSHQFGRNYFKLLNELGFMVYTFDFPCGSVKSRSNANTMEMSILDQQHDLETIVNHFKSRPDVDATDIVLIGESQGGLVAALTAADMPKTISRLVLVYPAMCIPDNWNERYPEAEAIPDTTRVWNVPLGRRYFLEARTLRPYDVISRYRNPVLILHGDADNVVPVSYSHRAATVYDDARLHIIKDAGHGFRNQHLQEAQKEINSFLIHHP